jgi:hypothetical protein
VETDKSPKLIASGQIQPRFLQGVCESRLVGPSGTVARVVSSVLLVTRQGLGCVSRALRMNRPGVHGDAGLAPAVGLIRSLSAFVA